MRGCGEPWLYEQTSGEFGPRHPECDFPGKISALSGGWSGVASTADDQQFTGTLPVKLLVKLPGGRPCPRLNLPAKDRWKNSGTSQRG